MIAFGKQGHRVISLSQQEGLSIHEFLRSQGVETYTHVLPGERVGWWYYLRHVLYFIFFCWKHNVQVIYSHLEPANFVASIGQYFVRAKIYLCRHHIDEGELYHFQHDFYYKVTYRLARHIIVVSDHARRYMIAHEKIPAHKIRHINLAYDYSLYAMPTSDKVRAIRARYPEQILLISACRLTQFKRPDVSVHTLKALVDRGFDAKLILLGKGEMQDELMDLVVRLGLSTHVIMPGFVDNVLEYMAAGDFFIHPSLLDSSCVAVKEAGLVGKPIIACKGIGDFEDYIKNGVNGFTVGQETFVEEATDIIARHHGDGVYLKSVGDNLNKDVLRLFDVRNIIPQYAVLNERR